MVHKYDGLVLAVREERYGVLLDNGSVSRRQERGAILGLLAFWVRARVHLYVHLEN